MLTCLCEGSSAEKQWRLALIGEKGACSLLRPPERKWDGESR